MRRRGLGRPAQPSLLNTAARTAVVVGTASAVSGRAASRQATNAQQAAPGQAPVPPPPTDVAPAGAAGPAPEAFSDDLYEQLKKLGELRDAGILTEDEFQAKKTQLLSS